VYTISVFSIVVAIEPQINDRRQPYESATATRGSGVQPVRRGVNGNSSRSQLSQKLFQQQGRSEFDSAQGSLDEGHHFLLSAETCPEDLATGRGSPAEWV
jgi:hypothetical protein